MRGRARLIGAALVGAALALGGVGSGGSPENIASLEPHCLVVDGIVYRVTGGKGVDNKLLTVEIGSPEMTEIVPSDQINSLCGKGFGE